ncbi:hypothetical protein KY289_030526 [Solanum tuberosum]|nr:hypothetical protein KY289_030526 [Solanum tuberosum]
MSPELESLSSIDLDYAFILLQSTDFASKSEFRCTKALLDELKDWEREVEGGKRHPRVEYKTTQLGVPMYIPLLSITKRMKGKKAKEQREATKELEHRIHMVKAPSVFDKEPSVTLPTKVKVSRK